MTVFTALIGKCMSIPPHFGTTVPFSTGVVSEWHAIRAKVPRRTSRASGIRVRRNGGVSRQLDDEHPNFWIAQSGTYPILIGKLIRTLQGALHRTKARAPAKSCRRLAGSIAERSMLNGD